jgi:hypothetical protein
LEFWKTRGRAHWNPKEQIQEEEQEAYLAGAAAAEGERGRSHVGRRWGSGTSTGRWSPEEVVAEV